MWSLRYLRSQSHQWKCYIGYVPVLARFWPLPHHQGNATNPRQWKGISFVILSYFHVKIINFLKTSNESYTCRVVKGFLPGSRWSKWQQRWRLLWCPEQHWSVGRFWELDVSWNCWELSSSWAENCLLYWWSPHHHLHQSWLKGSAWKTYCSDRYPSATRTTYHNVQFSLTAS